MALKSITPTQLFNTVQRLENVDIASLDFTKLPTGFDTPAAFEKAVSKTLSNTKSQFSNAYKSFEAHERNEKINAAIEPLLKQFDGDFDKVLEVLKLRIPNDESPNSSTNFGEQETPKESDSVQEIGAQGTNF